MIDGGSFLFAVTRARSGAWDFVRPMEEQPGWPAHAAFMNALHADGFARLVGPLEGEREVLLIVRASAVAEVEARLADDPWTVSGLLTTTRIARWTLRLGSLG